MPHQILKQDQLHDEEKYLGKLGEHCRWTSCEFSSKDTGALGTHVYETHINPQLVGLSSPGSSSGMANPFHCAYQDCHFESADYGDFTSHVRNEHCPDMWTPVSPDDIGASSAVPVSMVSDILPKNEPSTDQATSTNDGVARPVFQVKGSTKQQVLFTEGLNDASAQKTQMDAKSGLVCKWLHDDGTICARQFTSPQSLTEHLESEHVGTRQKEYYCRWNGCDRHKKPFKQRQKIARHLQIHTNNKPYRCEVCGHSFGEMHVLKQHMRVHSGEKPYECKVCGKRFAVSTALSVHMRTHTGEKPLVCKFPGCGKRFSESSNLAKHMKTHQRKLAGVDANVGSRRLDQSTQVMPQALKITAASAL
jgi:uncharacterized Zn-finger protein